MPPSPAQARLLAAIDKLDGPLILSALNDGADVNRPDGDGQAPLARAIQKALDLRPSVFDPYPTTVPAEMAERDRILRTVTLLLDKGANADYRLDGAGDALVWAAFANEAPIVKLLLARGADVNFRVDGEWFYDSVELDHLYHMTRREQAPDATEEDEATPEAFIAYLERKNHARRDGFPTEVLTLLRRAGATSERDEEPVNDEV